MIMRLPIATSIMVVEIYLLSILIQRYFTFFIIRYDAIEGMLLIVTARSYDFFSHIIIIEEKCF